MIELLLIMFSFLIISIYLYALFKLETYGDEVLKRLGHIEYRLDKIEEKLKLWR